MIMPVPKRKTSKQRRNLRNASKGVKKRIFAECKNCEQPIRPHAACTGCGFYKGVKVIETKADRAVRRVEKIQQIEAKSKKAEPAK
jgi:large subunit ribosomal protein L32